MSYAERVRCPECGSIVPTGDIQAARVECRRCRRAVDIPAMVL